MIKIKQIIKSINLVKIMFPAGRGTEIYDFDGEENK